MSLNVGDQEYNSGKKYRQKGALCDPNTDAVRFSKILFVSIYARSTQATECLG
jgi:hypothetical protein